MPRISDLHNVQPSTWEAVDGFIAEMLAAGPPVDDGKKFKCERDRVRYELRVLTTKKFREATGRTNAKMHWSPDGYADKIVKGERKKIAGVWPAGVPFGDPSHIQGGCAPLQKLLDAWERGEVWFADATAEDVRRAAMDPRSVLPGEPLRPRLRKSPYECPGSSRRRLPGLGPVLHSSHMGVVARPCPPEHVLAGRLESGRHTGRTGYREDNSATRARPVSNPENVPLQHARTGVKTGRWVMDYDGVEDGVIEVDDDLMRLLEEGVYEAVEGGEGCGESWV